MIGDFIRCTVALVRALVLFPFYYLLLTLFTLWPWRLGSPLFLVRHLAFVKTAPKAATLRLVQLRLAVRLDSFVDKREGSRPRVSAWRFRRWLSRPIRQTVPECVKLTRRELERVGELIRPHQRYHLEC